MDTKIKDIVHETISLYLGGIQSSIDSFISSTNERLTHVETSLHRLEDSEGVQRETAMLVQSLQSSSAGTRVAVDGLVSNYKSISASIVQQSTAISAIQHTMRKLKSSPVSDISSSLPPVTTVPLFHRLVDNISADMKDLREEMMVKIDVIKEGQGVVNGLMRRDLNVIMDTHRADGSLVTATLAGLEGRLQAVKDSVRTTAMKVGQLESAILISNSKRQSDSEANSHNSKQDVDALGEYVKRSIDQLRKEGVSEREGLGKAVKTALDKIEKMEQIGTSVMRRASLSIPPSSHSTASPLPDGADNNNHDDNDNGDHESSLILSPKNASKSSSSRGSTFHRSGGDGLSIVLSPRRAGGNYNGTTSSGGNFSVNGFSAGNVSVGMAANDGNPSPFVVLNEEAVLILRREQKRMYEELLGMINLEVKERSHSEATALGSMSRMKEECKATFTALADEFTFLSKRVTNIASQMKLEINTNGKHCGGLPAGWSAEIDHLIALRLASASPSFQMPLPHVLGLEVQEMREEMSVLRTLIGAEGRNSIESSALLMSKIEELVSVTSSQSNAAASLREKDREQLQEVQLMRDKVDLLEGRVAHINAAIQQVEGDTEGTRANNEAVAAIVLSDSEVLRAFTTTTVSTLHALEARVLEISKELRVFDGTGIDSIYNEMSRLKSDFAAFREVIVRRLDARDRIARESIGLVMKMGVVPDKGKGRGE